MDKSNENKVMFISFEDKINIERKKWEERVRKMEDSRLGR
jgi:hypothetical protein